MAPPFTPKVKTFQEDFSVAGLDLTPDDMPIKRNPKYQPILFAPAFCHKESSRQVKYRLNIAVILRAWDYFYEFRNNPDFWSRMCIELRPPTRWNPIPLQQIAERYVAARRRYLHRRADDGKVGWDMDVIIRNIADKLLSNEVSGISKIDYPPSAFDGRATQWAEELKDIDALLRPFRNSRELPGITGAPVPRQHTVNSWPQHKNSSSSPKSEVSESDDYSESEDFGANFNSGGPSPFITQMTAPPATHQTPSANPTVFGQPSVLTSTGNDQNRHTSSTPDRASGMSTDVKQFSIFGAANTVATGDATSTASKRPAVSDEATPDPKRRAMHPAEQCHSEQAFNDDINAETPASAREPRPSLSTATLRVDTTAHPAAASPRTPGPVSALARSSGTYTPILPDDAAPIHSPVSAVEAEIQRLRSACNDKDQHTAQLQETVVIMVNSLKSLEQRVSEEHEQVVRLRTEKSDLAAKLQAAEEKIAAMAAVLPSTLPATLEKNSMEVKFQDQTMHQAQHDHYLTERDYKGLLSHIANNVPKLTGPVFKALKQEEGNESSAKWQALEAGWIALDWAKEQLNNNANKL